MSEKGAVHVSSSSQSGSESPSEPHNAYVADRIIDGDLALKAISPEQGRVVVGKETNDRLLRRIDLMLMPILCTVYGLNFLDKITLSYASITGFQKDIGLRGDNYQWLGSVFYLSFLAFEYPASRLLQRLPLAKVSGACVILWGIVLAAFAGVRNFGDALAIRLLLGIFEASTSVAWTLFTSQWYRKEEQGIRTAWWISFNGFAQIFGGAVAYGLAHGARTQHYELAPWKIIYIFTGVLTIVMGVVFLVVIPDNQLNAWWLSGDDRMLAVERVRDNQQGIGNKKFKRYQFIEALVDPVTWAFVLIGLVAMIPNGGLTNFFSLIISSFGYNAEQTLLMGCISGAVEIVVVLGWAFTARYFKSRILVGIVGLFIALIGTAMLVGLPATSPKGRLAGFYLTGVFVAGLVAIVSLLSTNVAGYTKKTTVACLFFVAYCAGNVIGPQTFRPKDAPNYQPAKITILACWVIAILDMLFIFFWYRWQNQKKAAVRSAPGYCKRDQQEFLDLTDRENPEFVYTL